MRSRRDQRSPEAKVWQRFYKTPEWKRIRAAQLLKQPLCERHLKQGRIVKATIVHHVTPHKGNWALFLSGPFESACDDCHGGPLQKEEARGLAYSTAVDPATGFPLDPRHPANR